MSRSPAIRFVLTCIFLDALGIGLIIPVLPRLIGNITLSQEMQTAWYGIIMISYGLMQFAFAPLLGAFSDRVGRRPVLLIGIFGLALMMAVPAITSSLFLILLSRVIGGMMSSNIVVAQAYIADITPRNQRISNFGKIGSIFGIAFILGPALGGCLGHIDSRIPFQIASIICILNFVYGYFFLPESLPQLSSEPLTFHRLNPFGAINTLASTRTLRPLLLILTLFTLSQGLMQCTWALYTEYRYAWTPLMIGMSIFLLGISISITQGLLLPYLSRHYSPHRLIKGGLTLGFTGMILIGLSPSGEFSLFLVCLVGLMGIVGPTIQAIISRQIDTIHQGISMGALGSLNSFTGAISPLIGTPLLISTASFPLHPVLAGLPYFACALLLLAALFLARKNLTKKRPVHQEKQLTNRSLEITKD